jgi:hypothetical protein
MSFLNTNKKGDLKGSVLTPTVEQKEADNRLLSPKNIPDNTVIKFRILKDETETVPYAFEGYKLKKYKFYKSKLHPKMAQHSNHHKQQLNELWNNDIPKNEMSKLFEYDLSKEYLIRIFITDAPDEFLKLNNIETLTDRVKYIRVYPAQKTHTAKNHLWSTISSIVGMMDDEGKLAGKETNLWNFDTEIASLDFQLHKIDKKNIEYDANYSTFDDTSIVSQLPALSESIEPLENFYEEATDELINEFLGE